MPASEKIGNYRWVICALLLAATTINYLDRSVLGVLGPTLQYKVFNWSDSDYATINICFKAAYAIGLVGMGAVIDRFGTKIGYTLAISIWSVCAALHAAIRPGPFGLIGFCLARFGLGIGEGGNFPAGMKAVGEWFPQKERAVAVGIFNAGTNVGAILAPMIVPLVVLSDGTHWQHAFLITAAFSAAWIVVWVKTYQSPEVNPRVGTAELAYIQGDSTVETTKKKIPWAKLLPLRETWAFGVLKTTDAAFWFFVFWGGKFLFDQFGLDVKGLAWPLIIIYLSADVGSIIGGWLSSSFLKRGWTVNRARKTAMFICALFILPLTFTTRMGTRFEVNDRFFARLQTATIIVEGGGVTTAGGAAPQEKAREPVPAAVVTAMHTMDGQSFASAKEFIQALSKTMSADDEKRTEAALIESARSDNLYWIAVLLMALAAGAHQAWEANVFTFVTDIFPKKATASVTGLGGMAGALTGIAADYCLGKALTNLGPSGYFYAFLTAGLCYHCTLLIAHLLAPKMTPLDENLRYAAD